jgi:hypothetical protein
VQGSAVCELFHISLTDPLLLFGQDKKKEAMMGIRVEGGEYDKERDCFVIDGCGVRVGVVEERGAYSVRIINEEGIVVGRLVLTPKEKPLVRNLSMGRNGFLVFFTDSKLDMLLPYFYYPRLEHASPKERENWYLLGDGEGVHWPDLDEDLSAEGLSRGIPSVEYQRKMDDG